MGPISWVSIFRPISAFPATVDSNVNRDVFVTMTAPGWVQLYYVELEA